MRIAIEGPQFAEAIQQAEWVVEIEEMDTEPVDNTEMIDNNLDDMNTATVKVRREQV